MIFALYFFVYTRFTVLHLSYELVDYNCKVVACYYLAFKLFNTSL